MDSNFIHYHNAAQRVSQGWIRGEFQHGIRVCLVQSVIISAQIENGPLPDEFVRELDSQLKSYPMYRLYSLVFSMRGMATQEAIMAWNDVPWRRKKTVVKALQSLGDSMKLRWLDVERSRLMLEIEQLRHANAALQARVERLERENTHLWNRLLNYRQLRADHKTLEQIESNLSDKAHELETIG